MRCMSVRLSQSIASVWWLPESAMEAVRVTSTNTPMCLKFITIGPPSETYLRCLEEVQSISCATLFAPVVRCEAIQSMSACCFPCYICLLANKFIVIVSGWSDNGWLSGGHAVRMAMELCMWIL